MFWTTGSPNDPRPPAEELLGPPQALDKIPDEHMCGRGVVVKNPAPIGAGILTPTPAGDFVAQDLVWSPGAAPKNLRAGEGGHPGGARMDDDLAC